MYFCNMIFRHLLNMRSHPKWVRGLKQMSNPQLVQVFRVAPYVGAWIETAEGTRKRLSMPSHPTWVRGLKHLFRS